MKTKLSPGNMTEQEISTHVFKGAGPGEFRGLSDRFTRKQIEEIAANPSAGRWYWVAGDIVMGSGS